MNKKHSIFHNSLLFGITAVLLATAACSDYIDIEDAEGKPIRLKAGLAYDPTRAAVDLQGPVFEAGTEVNVFITGTTNEQTTPVQIGNYPTVFTTSEPKGTAGSQYNDLNPPAGETPHYLTGAGSKAKIMGAYPTSVKPDPTLEEPDHITFTVKDDQTSDDNYRASDLMLTGVVNHDKNATTVNLPFEHKMAKIIISAIGEPGVTVDDEIIIGCTTDVHHGVGIYRSIDLDMSKADYKSPLDYSETTSEYIPLGLSNRGQITIANEGAVLIPPQMVTTADFIVVKGHTAGNPTTRKAYFSIASKMFEAGKEYKLTLAISANNFQEPDDPNPISVSITGWTSNYGELTLMPYGGYQGVGIASIDPVMYDGTAHTPKPEVTYGTGEGSKLLREGSTKDFIYNYVDNKNAGHAQVLVIGQNYYAGLAQVQGFVINKRLGKVSFPANSARKGDDGNGIEFAQNLTLPAIKANNTAADDATLKADGDITYSAEDANGNPTSVITVDQTDGTVNVQSVGRAFVRATVPLGSPNLTPSDGKNFFYTDGVEEGTVNTYTDRYEVLIKAKQPKMEGTGSLKVVWSTGNKTEIEGETADKDTYFVYDGSKKSLASLTVSDGDYTLAAGEPNGTDGDYTYTFLNNEGTDSPLHQGTYKLVIKGRNNYYSTTPIEIPIEIKQAKPTLSMTKDRKKYLWIGQYSASAPTDRRTTRPATTEYWAQNSLRYSSLNSGIAKVDPTTGLITGVAPGETFIVAHVDADGSTHQDYSAADTIRFPVKVVKADFEFKLTRIKKSGYEEPQLRRDANGVPIGAHTEWVCPAKGNWQLDCYGAQGANTPNHQYENGDGEAYPAKAAGGKGAHVSGQVELPRNKLLYVNVGEQGRNVYTGATRDTTQVPHFYYELDGFAWNGGGNVVWGGLIMMDNMGSKTDHSDAPFNTDATSVRNVIQDVISGGGGATDISLSWAEYPQPTKMKINQSGFTARFFDWKSAAHLYSRVMVAGGGGGGIYYLNENGYGNGGDGGAWTGENGKWFDYGEGGQMDRGGRGGMIQNWKTSPTNSPTTWRNQTMRHQMIYYLEGPFAGGYSCTDGMFGEGGNYTQTRQGCGAGGGGWYGGGSGGEQSSNGSGGGGSSFVWSEMSVTKSSANSSSSVKMYTLYDTIESDWNGYLKMTPDHTGRQSNWHDGDDAYETTSFAAQFGNISNFQPYMPTTDASHSTRKDHNNVINYFTNVKADQGANQGDGWATIRLVQIDEDQ